MPYVRSSLLSISFLLIVLSCPQNCIAVSQDEFIQGSDQLTDQFQSNQTDFAGITTSMRNAAADYLGYDCQVFLSYWRALGLPGCVVSNLVSALVSRDPSRVAGRDNIKFTTGMFEPDARLTIWLKAQGVPLFNGSEVSYGIMLSFRSYKTGKWSRSGATFTVDTESRDYPIATAERTNRFSGIMLPPFDKSRVWPPLSAMLSVYSTLSIDTFVEFYSSDVQAPIYMTLNEILVLDDNDDIDLSQVCHQCVSSHPKIHSSWSMFFQILAFMFGQLYQGDMEFSEETFSRSIFFQSLRFGTGLTCGYKVPESHKNTGEVIVAIEGECGFSFSFDAFTVKEASKINKIMSKYVITKAKSND